MNPITPGKKLAVKFRSDNSEAEILVIEIGFKAFYECFTSNSYDTEVAERAVRLANSDTGEFDMKVPRGYLDRLTDESVEEVVRASNELNITAARAKKALGLLGDRSSREAASTSVSGADKLKSSSPAATNSPSSSTIPAASSASS